jgi:D-alanine--poly(phosphoribitol) ligase subunit 2
VRQELQVLGDYVRTESGYKGQLDPDVDLLDANILDSFSIVQLAVFVQERFGVDLEPDDLTRENLASLSRIVALIDRRRSNSAPPVAG